MQIWSNSIKSWNLGHQQNAINTNLISSDTLDITHIADLYEQCHNVLVPSPLSVDSSLLDVYNSIQKE